MPDTETRKMIKQAVDDHMANCPTQIVVKAIESKLDDVAQTVKKSTERMETAQRDLIKGEYEFQTLRNATTALESRVKSCETYYKEHDAFFRTLALKIILWSAGLLIVGGGGTAGLISLLKDGG